MRLQDSGGRRARVGRSLVWVLAAGGLAVASLALLTRCVLNLEDGVDLVP